MKLKTINIDQIDEGKRARQQFENIQELCDSIKEVGLVSPISVVKQDNDEQPFLLLHGGRRIRASKLAGNDTITAVIRDDSLTEGEMWNIELVENLHRENLTWQEEVTLKEKIHDFYIDKYGQKKSTSKDATGWSQADTAKFLGISTSKLSRDIQMAKAIDKFPSLSEYKTQSDANKVLDATAVSLERKMIAKVIEDKKSSTDIDILNDKLSKQYMTGDFFDGVKKIQSSSIDLIEIDPPYGIDLAAKGRKLKSKARIEVGGYNEVPSDEYLKFLDGVIKEAVRVMKPDSWLLLWFAPEPWFDSAYSILKKHGLTVKRIPAMWLKGDGWVQTMQPKYNLANGYEMMYYARKGSPEIFTQGKTNTFNFSPIHPNKKTHPTERPIEMMDHILNIFCKPDSKICVPFLGSGNTVLAADNLNMTAFGWDLTRGYRDGFIIKVGERKSRDYKFKSYRDTRK